LLLHALLYALLCLAPALVLLPVRILDRAPRNEVTHEQPGEDDDERDPGAGIVPAAA
jgi:hypothetical protein